MQNIISLISGILFGFGIAFSDMLSPQRVQGFFDVFGEWDMTLLFVMIGALAVSFVGHFFLKKRCKKPIFSPDWHFSWEKTGTIDKKLIIGSVLFGIGWGIAGLCPGPAIGGLIFFHVPAVIFLISMIISMGVYKLFTSSK